MNLPLALFDEHLPPWCKDTCLFGFSLWQWLELGTLALTALLAGTLLQALLVRLGRWVSRRTHWLWDEHVVETLPGPTRILLALFLFNLGMPLLHLIPVAEEVVTLVVRTVLIATVTWWISRLLSVAFDYLELSLSRGVDNPLRLRSIKTQLTLPRGILRVLAILVGVSLILLQFEIVRSVGVSFLASAGVAGIVLGLAAQRTVGNVLAGLQLALTQPIKEGDAVLVEGEYGWIEEITLTYIVVKVWDQRRLVLPISSFLDKPFQNWTKNSTELLGTVYLYADYSVSVEELRKTLRGILAETTLWDGRVQAVQLTNLAERHVEVRVLVSAKDAGQLWELRCLVREQLLGWLQKQGHAHLPVQRVQIRREDSPS